MPILLKISICFGIAAAWLASIPDQKKNYLGRPNSGVSIRTTTALIKFFKKSRGRIPVNLGELRLFSIEHNIPSKRPYLPYDGFATRIIYQPLDHDYYTLTGSDYFRIKKGMGTSASRIAPIPQHIINQSKIDTGSSNHYPAIILEGSSTTGAAYFAKLYQFAELNQKYLVVQSIETPELIKVSNHPNVEEYFWVNKSKIIYSATGAERYEDGLYIWDLDTNEQINLLKSDSALTSINSGTSRTNVVIALAKLENEVIYFYMTTENNLDVSYFDFFDEKYYFKINLKSDSKSREKAQLSATSNTLEPEFYSKILDQKNFNGVQHLWALLHDDEHQKDPVELSLENWQNFVITNPNSPMKSYALIKLTFLYWQAYQVFKKDSPDLSTKLLSFGNDLAESAAGYIRSPKYLAALATHQQMIYASEKRLVMKKSGLGPVKK